MRPPPGGESNHDSDHHHHVIVIAANAAPSESPSQPRLECGRHGSAAGPPGRHWRPSSSLPPPGLEGRRRASESESLDEPGLRRHGRCPECAWRLARKFKIPGVAPRACDSGPGGSSRFDFKLPPGPPRAGAVAPSLARFDGTRFKAFSTPSARRRRPFGLSSNLSRLYSGRNRLYSKSPLLEIAAPAQRTLPGPQVAVSVPRAAAQWFMRRVENPEVPGSRPARA
jgi:hypothetical protein